VANDERYPVWSGALVTAGDVAFYGTLDGWFKAADAKTARPVAVQGRIGVVGNPITYTGPDRKQYVALTPGSAATGSCWRGTSGLMTGGCAAAADFMSDIARHTSQGGIVWIFAL